MGRFLRQFEAVLSDAQRDGLIAPETVDLLVARASEHDGQHRFGSVAMGLAAVGGLTVFLGLLLLVSANWAEIPGWFKIAALLTLLGGCHAAGFWIRGRGLERPKTAEALHFVGAGLFIVGVGLISQVYHINGRPPDGVLWWLAAIVPLALLLRSPSITVMSVFALLLWGHMEGSYAGSPLEMPDSFTAHLVFEIATGSALLFLAAAASRFDQGIATALRGCGIVLLFGGMYLAGFYRHFTEIDSTGNLYLPGAAFIAGAAGLGFGFRQLVADAPGLRAALIALIAALLVWCGVALAVDYGALPEGRLLEFHNFGWTRQTSIAAWSLTLAAWALWFLLAFWCVALGAQTGRLHYLNLGVLGIGLGVVTRFFDLVGTLAHTGLLFLVGGAVLLITGWLVERWRRSIVWRWRGAT